MAGDGIAKDMSLGFLDLPLAGLLNLLFLFGFTGDSCATALPYGSASGGRATDSADRTVLKVGMVELVGLCCLLVLGPPRPVLSPQQQTRLGPSKYFVTRRKRTLIGIRTGTANTVGSSLFDTMNLVKASTHRI